ncbi:hypothetical protein BST97_02320 [Nonlabens spongiae]|uniref:Uncharacterized protein n=1 Tax=Nonlabens spongiae TaxID=331648 RepID=A0A1W6MH57_9FLAO|nr:hypothetical protein BST97_02320 [Nonlabens spongiae]
MKNLWNIKFLLSALAFTFIFSLLFSLSDVSFQWQHLTLWKFTKQFIFFVIIFLVTTILISRGAKGKKEN